MQHLVRNVTTAVLVCAVPLLAWLQYTWLSELARAQHTEVRQSWHEAVVRSAEAVNGDFSAFYAAVIGQTRSDMAALTHAMAEWRERSALGPLFHVMHPFDPADWLPLNEAAGVPHTATWVTPADRAGLPAMVVSLPPGPRSSQAIALTFEPNACERLLRTLAGRYFAFATDVRLAIVKLDPGARPACADPTFAGDRPVDGRASIFRLRPSASAAVRRRTRGVGIAMSRDSGAPAWELQAQGGEPLAAAVRRAQRRNLWLATVLECILVAGIAAIAVAARRATRTAADHLRFSAAVAHELRTPLAAIKVLAQNQARGLVHRDEQIAQYGETIVAETDRLHQFVERVLQFSSGQAGARLQAFAPVDFERIIAAALAPLRSRIVDGGLALQTVVEPDTGRTLGDEAGLIVALRNLLQNVLDHAAGASRIAVSIRRDDDWIILSITDDGCGVAPEDRSGLFQPFSRGRQALGRRVPGHGLGLAIVRGVARAHGGRAWYTATSEGSQFAFSIRRRT